MEFRPLCSSNLQASEVRSHVHAHPVLDKHVIVGRDREVVGGKFAVFHQETRVLARRFPRLVPLSREDHFDTRHKARNKQSKKENKHGVLHGDQSGNRIPTSRNEMRVDFFAATFVQPQPTKRFLAGSMCGCAVKARPPKPRIGFTSAPASTGGDRPSGPSCENPPRVAKPWPNHQTSVVKLMEKWHSFRFL